MGFRMFIAKAIFFVSSLFDGTLLTLLEYKVEEDLKIIKELICPDTQEEEEFMDYDYEMTEIEKRFGPIRLTEPKK